MNNDETHNEYQEENRYNNKPPRMRTLPKAYEEIKEFDPQTSISMRDLRRMVSNGDIPTVKISNKVLINLDLLLAMLACYNKVATCT